MSNRNSGLSEAPDPDVASRDAVSPGRVAHARLGVLPSDDSDAAGPWTEILLARDGVLVDDRAEPLGRLPLAELTALGADSADDDVPSREEAGAALRTLLRYSSAHRAQAWQRAVDGLVDSASLDVDQLYQAQRHAALRRWVLEHVPLLSPGEMGRLLVDRVGADSNTARRVERLRREGELVAIPFKSGWRYPAAQLDRRGRVHAALPELVRRATAQDYEPWEIVYWLARPTERRVPAAVGRPLVGGRRFDSVEAMYAAIAEETPGADPVRPGPSPFALLAAGEEDAFGEATRHWLG